MYTPEPIQFIKSRIKELGRIKHDFEHETLVQLKKELGLYKTGIKKPYPNTITYHPKFDEFEKVLKQINDLDREIRKLRISIPVYPTDNFESAFVAVMKQKHQSLYEEIKSQIKEKRKNRVDNI